MRASRTSRARLVKPSGGPYLSLITEPREVRDGAEGSEAVPPAMLRQWRVGRRVEPRHDPGHQPGDRRDIGHRPADGRRGGPAGDRGGGPGAGGLAREERPRGGGGGGAKGWP